MAESIERGGLISPKDISVPLKGSPDLKEEGEGYVGELWEEAEGDPESQQGERDGRKKEREEGLPWQYIRSPGVTRGGADWQTAPVY